MQTSPLLKKATACFLFLFGSFFLLSLVLSQQACKTAAAKENKVYKNVSATEINEAIAKSKSKKILLNIYPVKLSGDVEKNDFDFAIVFQDAIDSGKNLGSEVDVKNFEQQSAWYVSYLKSKNIPQNKIAYGYYIELDSASVDKSKGISLTISPEKNQLGWCNVERTSTMASDSAIGQCPPACCPSYTMFSDSAIGQCPPACPPAPLYMASSMKMTIARTYNLK